MLGLLVLAMGCGEATPETQAENTEDATDIADVQEEVVEEVVEEIADNDIIISGTERDEDFPNIDGQMEVVSAFAEEGFDYGVEFLISTYQIEEDPQFGWSVPTGIPSVPEGGLILTCRLNVEDGLQVGEYTSEDNELGRIGNIGLYHSSCRINPISSPVIVITEVTDEYIKGEISTVGETEYQQFAAINGHFKLEIL